MSNIFINGSQWIRFDCHLHTKEDNQFVYTGSNGTFYQEYSQKLKNKEISVGVITNHNKFNRHEFKQLKKGFSDGYLLAGVELAIKEGSNGIHALIVFSEAWHTNQTDEDFVNKFLVSVSEGQSNFATKDGKTNTDLIETIKKLEVYKQDHRDYFIILAHVDSNSGFFKELDGGIIKHLSSNTLFNENILAFQKTKSNDKREHLANDFAKIEGSDPKNIEEIGKGEKSFIKIGDFNFEAVKFALQNKELRISNEVANIQNSYIKSISFDGGKLSGKTIELSAAMNNLIGVRGSGKSSIIEAIRYALGLEQNGSDREYKNNLVKELLGSAGKVVLIVMDKNKNEYTIERSFGHSVQIKKEGELKNIGIEAIIQKPLYFGQKDLSNYKEGFENDLIDKLIGDKTKEIKEKIQSVKQEVKITLENIKKYASLDEKKVEVKRKIEEFSLKIEEFKKYKIEEKLIRQIEFNKDKSSIQNIKQKLSEYTKTLDDFIEGYEEIDFFEKLKQYSSKENSDIFTEIYMVVEQIKNSFVVIKNERTNSNGVGENFKTIIQKFDAREKQLQEEFLEIQRTINMPNLRADDFINYTKELNTQNLMLSEIEKASITKDKYQNQLSELLSRLGEFYRDEFKIIEQEIDLINNNQTLIELKAEFKGDKEAYEKYLKIIFSGTGLGVADYQTLLNYPDAVEIHKNIGTISFGGNKLLSFREKFSNSLSSLLTYQVPNKIEIYYKRKELKKHSLGQRASALIIFILTQKENDIIIIDQPEDDLDNQTIYNEVIKEIVKLKNITQFIFATHNANIPVLGDCEQVIVCDYEENKIHVECGSIDKHEIQKEIIAIMEGGQNAFTKRKEIYNLWNH